MFKYSDDQCASNQKISESLLLHEIHQFSTPYHSVEIQNIFDCRVKNYNPIILINELSVMNDNPIIIPIIPNTRPGWMVKNDFDKAFNKLNKPKDKNKWLGTLPYIEADFPNDYNCKYGLEYKNSYIFCYKIY